MSAKESSTTTSSTTTTPTTTTTTTPGLTDNEREEMKALQDERKATEGHMSDSHRLRLSELQNRDIEGKQQQKKSGSGSTSNESTLTTKESKGATGK